MHPHDACGGANNQLFSSFIRYGLVIGPHLWIFMMLIGQRPDWHHSTTFVFAVHDFGPDIRSQIGAQKEPLGPMVCPNLPLLILKQKRQVDLF